MDITTHARDDGITHVVLSGQLDTTAAPEHVGEELVVPSGRSRCSRGGRFVVHSPFPFHNRFCGQFQRGVE